MGIDEIGGLTEEEKQATVRDLLTARSGIYHPASNDGDDLASGVRLTNARNLEQRQLQSVR